LTHAKLQMKYQSSNYYSNTLASTAGQRAIQLASG